MSPVDLTDWIAALRAGRTVLVPTDTVYGIGAHLDDDAAVERMYALKGRPRSQPCQVLVYSPLLLADIIAAMPEGVRGALTALLPGTTTCIVPDVEGRFSAASGDNPGSVGLRAPIMEPAFAAVDIPLVATSANDPGGPDPRRVVDVPRRVRDGLGAIVDMGELPGVASAVVDLRTPGRAVVIRPGPEPSALAARLSGLGLAVAVPE